MKIVVVIIAVLSIFALAIGYDMYATPKLIPVQADEPSFNSLGIVPDFTFETIEGKKLSIADFRGKVVIMKFWATWCATCTIEMPDMLDLVKSYGGGIVLLAISSDSKIEEITKFIDKHDEAAQKIFKSSDVYVALDANRAITYDMFLTERYPETIIIAPNGEMVRKIVGEFDWSSEKIKSYLTQLIELPEK